MFQINRFTCCRVCLTFLLVWLLAGCARGGDIVVETAVPQSTFRDYLEEGEELSGGQATVNLVDEAAGWAPKRYILAQ